MTLHCFRPRANRKASHRIYTISHKIGNCRAPVRERRKGGIVDMLPTRALQRGQTRPLHVPRAATCPASSSLPQTHTYNHESKPCRPTLQSCVVHLPPPDTPRSNSVLKNGTPCSLALSLSLSFLRTGRKAETKYQSRGNGRHRKGINGYDVSTTGYFVPLMPSKNNNI